MEYFIYSSEDFIWATVSSIKLLTLMYALDVLHGQPDSITRVILWGLIPVLVSNLLGSPGHLFQVLMGALSHLLILPKPVMYCGRVCGISIPGEQRWLITKHRLEQGQEHSWMIFHWTAFTFDDDMHSLWHDFDNLMQHCNIYVHPELHSFFQRSCIDNGGVEPL